VGIVFPDIQENGSPENGGIPAVNCDKHHTFHNWARTLSFQPDRFCQPESVQDVVDIVTEARKTPGRCVRVQGAVDSHSWSQFTVTRDVLVNLDKLNKPLIADILKKRYTIQAGVRIKDLVKILAKDNLGMQNTGSIMEQSIAGAISTGTHGTGIRLGNLATQVVGMKLVNGKGEVIELKEGDDRLKTARVNFGALGIIVEVTLQCIDNCDLEFKAYWCRLDDILDKIDTMNAENDRIRIWWFPKPLPGVKHDVILSTMNTPGVPPGVLGQFDDMTGHAGNSLQGSSLPFDLETLLNALAQLAVNPTRPVLINHFIANYVNVLTLPPFPILHRECEYAFPVKSTKDALIRIRRFMVENDFATTLPFEFRFVAADDTRMSPVRDRASCYAGANTDRNANEVFQRFEPLMKTLDGRPHWGKHFTMTKSEITAMYGPGYTEFANLRAAWDPDNVFANSLIHDLFD
jgi:FAD/FMN-containing dehydrogenase